MGQCFSDTASLTDFVNRPGVEDKQLTAEDIKRGLGLTAKHLKSKKKQITVVAVGGAINTILLRSRASTADVDFFSVDAASNPILRDGIKSAAKTMQLGEGWMNNHTALFIAPNTKTNLYNEAISDGVVIFDEPGLKVLAAPWMYCLVAKLEKAGKRGNAKSYDMSDASQYLIQESKRRGAKIKVADIEAKAIAYEAKIQEGQIKELKALCGGYIEE
ncbi:uncharacterized protein HD556DRAFT_1442236 [Suillus plorans]|uniref:DUF7582 domain-containing protein n=1 Tax=Suillus plorans TaxID=116603 RepID=A0A9P7DI45_9AGAM|nr:uncharacterized protein HD556DRAFT_1442236 [Suillus plorans]KAG1795393.1 hypothetical protein HD556DRAFT_1442236 [Suillus plorans]